MNSNIGKGIARLLVAAGIASTVSSPGLVTVTSVHGASSHAVAGATSLPTRSEDNLHFQAQDSVQLYNSPAGTSQPTIVPLSSWLRDTTLVPLTSTTTLHPARSPIDIRLAPSLATTTTAITTTTAVTTTTPNVAGAISGLATINNEDKVPLGLSVATLAGQPPLPAAGQVISDTITYPSAAPSTDFALHTTAEGLDARVVLHNPAQAGSLTFTLAVPANFHLVQESNGTISVNQTITVYSDQGAPAFTEEDPEYYVELPVVRDSSTDTSAPITYGTATLSLGTRTGNTQQISVTIDPTWLHDPHRVFPIQLDLPVVTGPAAARTGIFGTLNSCQPDLPAPAARMIVGVQGGCTYHGTAYLDMAPLGLRWSVQSIQSAILSLYTPNQTGPTGVEVYPNTPPTKVPRYAPLSWQPPSWNSAPAQTASATGIPQSGSDGHWQYWDITSLVQQWQNVPHSNGGITLVGNGAPVVFASAAGAGDDGPAYAPYLNITFAPPSSTASTSAAGISQDFSLGDPVNNIYGVSQGLTPDGTCGSAPQCASGLVVNTVHNWGASYIRIEAALDCVPSYVNPGYSWWSSNYGTPMYALLNSAYNDGLIPIVDFNYPQGNCAAGSFSWANQLQDFVNNLRYPGSPLQYRSLPWPNTYFEIENEPNLQPDWNSYASNFASAAPALNSALTTFGLSNGRILTGGVVAPDSGFCGNSNTPTIESAISSAMTNGVPQGRLGVAVHPYGYTTSDSGQWDNFKGQLGFTTTTCSNLGYMIGTWAIDDFPNLPVFFTEINFASDSNTVTEFSNGADSEGENGETAYVADLVTYLTDYGWANVSNSQIRSMWYTGVEHTDHLGIYTPGAAEKYPSTQSTFTCGAGLCTAPGLAQGLICYDLSNLNGKLNDLSYTYAYLIKNAPCF